MNQLRRLRGRVRLAIAASLVVVMASAGAASAGYLPAPKPRTTSEPKVNEIGAPPISIEGVLAKCGASGIYGWGSVQAPSMGPAMRYGCTPTPLSRERRAILTMQVTKAREVALSIGTAANAERLGYVKNWQRVEGRGYEYVNWDNFTTEFDLNRPGVIAFEDDKPDSRIVSVAYNVLGRMQDGPPTELPLEVIPWHYHSNFCRKGDSIVGTVNFDYDNKPYAADIERCKQLGATFVPELGDWMTDLWVVPGWENPWGLTSSKHPDLFDTPAQWFPTRSPNEAGGFSPYCSLTPRSQIPTPDPSEKKASADVTGRRSRDQRTK